MVSFRAVYLAESLFCVVGIVWFLEGREYLRESGQFGFLPNFMCIELWPITKKNVRYKIVNNIGLD